MGSFGRDALAEMQSAAMLISTTEAAEKLNVHPRTVRRYIAEGVLKAYRLNKRNWRIAPDDLVTLLGGDRQ